MNRIYVILLITWDSFSSWLGKIKRSIWNRGIKFYWDYLLHWDEGKDEAYNSIGMDSEAIRDMNPEQEDRYTRDLYRRRKLVHKRDLAK